MGHKFLCSKCNFTASDRNYLLTNFVSQGQQKQSDNDEPLLWTNISFMAICTITAFIPIYQVYQFEMKKRINILIKMSNPEDGETTVVLIYFVLFTCIDALFNSFSLRHKSDQFLYKTYKQYIYTCKQTHITHKWHTNTVMEREWLKKRSYAVRVRNATQFQKKELIDRLVLMECLNFFVTM